MPVELKKHPAKYSPEILAMLEQLIVTFDIKGKVLDPFAGTGLIHSLENAELETYGSELEPEWAGYHPRTVCANILDMPFPRSAFDAVIVSPAYGNRMADKYAGDAKGSTRHTYRVYLGRELSPESGAVMQWGPQYRSFHMQAWTSTLKHLRVGGTFILNCKNHIRKNEVQKVVEWHEQVLQYLGCEMFARELIPVRGQKQGQNGDARVDHEVVTCFMYEPEGAPWTRSVASPLI